MARRFFLLLFLFFSHSVTVQSVIYELKEQQVQFDPNITGQPEQILWLHNGKFIVESDGLEAQVSDSYKDRLTLNQSSAQLQISDLRLEDSGKYDYEIRIGGIFFHQSYELEVREKVAKPNITCQMNNSSSSTVSAVLLCSVEPNQPQSSVNFTWISRGNIQDGPQLTISLGVERDEEEYTCRVSNPRSNETATFRAKDCPKALTKKSDAGSSAGMIAGIVLISILNVIVCMGLLILLWRQRRKNAGSSAEVIFGIVLFLLLIVHMGLVILLWRLKHKNAGSSAGMIAGIVLIFILNVIVCMGLLILLWRQRRKRCGKKQEAPAVLMNGERHPENPPTQTVFVGLDQITFQNGGKRPELDEEPRPSSPLLGQQDTTEDPERQQREAKSHAESDFSNSPNMAPQDTHVEHNNDASADYKSDSSCRGKQDQSDNSPTRDIQQPTNPGPTGSEATQDEKDPNLSCVSD